MNRALMQLMFCLGLLTLVSVPPSAEAQDALACSCTGTTCGSGGVDGEQGDVYTDVSQAEADDFFLNGPATGWTCITPASIRGEGGPLACFCQNFCGNGGVGADPDSIYLGLTPERINESFGGGAAGNQTGWLCGDYRGDYSPDGEPPPRFFQMNAGLNDAWYDPATDGQGFYLAVFPDTGLMALAWFTFDTEAPAPDTAVAIGGPGQRWLSAVGGWDGNVATLTVVNTTGGRFDRSTPVVERDDAYGTLTLEFHDCANATLTYELPQPALSGSIELTRVVRENVAVCEALLGL